MQADKVDQGNDNQRKVEQLLGIAALVLLLIGVFYVLKSFMTAILWSVILAYALYPVQRLLTKWFRGRSVLAAVVVALVLSVLLVGPMFLLGMSLKDDAVRLGDTTWNMIGSLPEKTPEKIKNIPVIGARADKNWEDFTIYRKKWMARFEKAKDVPPKAIPVSEYESSAPPPLPPSPTITDGKSEESMPSQLPEYLGKVVAWLNSWLPHLTFLLGRGIFQIIFSMLLTFFILCNAVELGERLGVVMHRIAGERGQRLMHVAGKTVKGVVYGIIGTAVAQGVLAGVGLGFAGVPAAVLLGVLTFFLSAVPIGPPLVWIPAAIWLFSTHQTGWGIFILVWGVFVVSGVDNIIKPYLISHGSKIPFVVVLMGVIGGAIGFGPVGIFLGPTLLSVAYRMIAEWSSSKQIS